MHLPWSLSGFDLQAQSRGWLRWNDAKPKQLTCPACGETAEMTSRMDTASPAHRFRRFSLYECPTCGSGHFPGLEPPAYEGKAAKSGERIRETAALKYYLEQGAGILSMVSPLMALADRRDLSLLEVGCGYGLSLHFAREALGWKVQGCDPSSLARVGAEDLGLDIMAEYLAPGLEVPGAPFDVIYSSEVIEHVPDPVGFLQTLNAFRSDKGTIILTTPNIAGIRQGRSLDSLLPLVSPGSHLILFSEAGLKATLQRAGLEHAEVRASGDTLYAWAGALDKLGFTPANEQQAMYRHYLARQAKSFAKTQELHAGFAGRLVKELGNIGDHAQLGSALAQLGDSWKEQYGLDLSEPDAMQLPDAQKLPFEEFARQTPLNLPVVLYYAGMHAWQGKGYLDTARQYFLACGAAGSVLQDAYRKVNVIDLEIMILAGLARVHAVEMIIASDPARAADELSELQTEDLPDNCQDTLVRVRDSLFASATHTGQWKIAAPFADEIAERYRQLPADNPLTRNVLAALASFALNFRFDRMQGLFWLDRALSGPDEADNARLREIFHDHAFAEINDRLGSDDGIPVLEPELQHGLELGKGMAQHADTFRQIASRLRTSDPSSSWQWLNFARHDAMPTAEWEQMQDQLEQDFVNATGRGDVTTAQTLQADAAELAAEKGDTAPSLLLALGLDALNRMGDPCGASFWLQGAKAAGDADTSRNAEDALVIARKQISDELIQACAAGRRERAGELAEALDMVPEDGETLYALGMHALNHQGEMMAAQEYFARCAQIPGNPDLQARARFHQALALSRAGEIAQAREIADQLFDKAGKENLPHGLRAREAELRQSMERETTT